MPTVDISVELKYYRIGDISVFHWKLLSWFLLQNSSIVHGLLRSFMSLHPKIHVAYAYGGFDFWLFSINCSLMQKSDGVKYYNLHTGDQWGDHVNREHRADQIVLHLGNQIDGGKTADVSSEHVLPNAIALQTDLVLSNKGHGMQSHIEGQFDSIEVNGSSNMVHGGQLASDNTVVSQIASPSITLFNPNRYIRCKYLT